MAGAEINDAENAEANDVTAKMMRLLPSVFSIARIKTFTLPSTRFSYWETNS